MTKASTSKSTDVLDMDIYDDECIQAAGKITAFHRILGHDRIREIRGAISPRRSGQVERLRQDAGVFPYDGAAPSCFMVRVRIRRCSHPVRNDHAAT